jgi:uracil-DNA glycosylase family protein
MSELERPGAQQWVPPRPSLRNLREAVQGCRGCELHRDANHGVMGEGSLRSDLLVIGEQPGDQEDLQGRPFVGPAGKLLDQALEEAGIDPGRVFRTNVVKHFRHEGTRGKQRIHKSPSRWHVAACGPWLVAEVGLVRPRGVVILGATAGQALHGSAFRVGEARGLLRPWPGVPGETGTSHVPEWVLATTHPAAVLRSRRRAEDLAALVEDLRVAARALEGREVI